MDWIRDLECGQLSNGNCLDRDELEDRTEYFGIGIGIEIGIMNEDEDKDSMEDSRLWKTRKKMEAEDYGHNVGFY